MTGRNVLVTGAAQGIGLAIATAFAEAGAAVALCDRNVDTLEAATAELRRKIPGAKLASVEADVSDPDQVRRMVAEAAGELSTIDILVNNAGFGFLSYFWETTPEEWNTVLATTLTGTFLCSREVVRLMLERKERGGKIINIASTNSIIPTTGIGAYCAAKGGVLMFTRVAALELAPHGITVNAVGPGSTLTPVTEGFFNIPGIREALLDRTPMGRFGEPVDIARVVLLLASDEADWITGQIILADGGQSLLGLPRYLEGILEAADGGRS